jgi:hypothetical protein
MYTPNWDTPLCFCPFGRGQQGENTYSMNVFICHVPNNFWTYYYDTHLEVMTLLITGAFQFLIHYA